MKTLPTQFTEANFEHRQVYRDGNLAVFERNRRNSKLIHFEAVRIKAHNGFTIAGKEVPPGESYPSLNAWGTDGFTLTTHEKAMAKVADMAREALAKRSQRVFPTK